MSKLILIALSLIAASGIATAEAAAQYRVTITNISPGQTFTPLLVATHSAEYELFSPGQPAREALAILAEGGDTAPLGAELAGVSTEVTTIPGLLGPGESASITVEGMPAADVLSVAAMLIPTNDTFMALASVRLPRVGSSTHQVPAYDAGTEANDQSCQSIPGPRCAGEGYSPEPADGDEGFVHIGNGFHELPTPGANGAEVLGPQRYDWRNPVAMITILRLH